MFEDLDSLVREDSRTYFLNEVDGLQVNEGVLMIGRYVKLRGRHYVRCASC